MNIPNWNMTHILKCVGELKSITLLQTNNKHDNNKYNNNNNINNNNNNNNNKNRQLLQFASY